MTKSDRHSVEGFLFEGITCYRGQRKKGSLFDKLVTFINNMPESTVFSRKQMLMATYGSTKSNSTIDKWRRQLTVCGYIADTYCAGEYQVVNHLEHNLTSSYLEEMYHDILCGKYKDSIEWWEKCWKKSCKVVQD